MASSSSPPSSAEEKVCFHCNSPSVNFFTGWQLRNGDFAMLCHSCASAYANGTFCETFHPEATGWRVCASCKKRIHCGCIMASHMYTILDVGGVQCTECAINGALEPHRCSPSFGSPEAMQHSMDSPEKLSDNSGKALAGINSEVDPLSSPHSVICDVLSNMRATPAAGVAIRLQSPLSETGEESSENSPGETNNFCYNIGENHQRVGSKPVQFRYRPKASSEELEQICRVSKSNLTPLFEKKLTASDADTRNGRLVLPKRCAEAYFPPISGLQGSYITLQDIEGNDWKVYYRYWLNTNGKMYVLEGLKDYIILTKWEAGDKVTFYKREADGKLVMGLQKVLAENSDQKSPI